MDIVADVSEEIRNYLLTTFKSRLAERQQPLY